MSFHIRAYTEQDLADVIELSLLAWQAVFDSYEQLLGSTIFRVAYPDWRAQQQAVVETYCEAQVRRTVWVAERESRVVGFLVCDLNHESKVGDVQLLAVHPDEQNRGIGTKLNELALAHMREHGMKVAYVGTGGDPGHAPARRSYEKAGFRAAIPAVHYYQEL